MCAALLCAAPARAAVVFTLFSSSDCSGPPQLPPGLAWSNACSSLAGAYGMVLSQCSPAALSTSPLEVTLFSVDATPPTCASSVLARFASPSGTSACVPHPSLFGNSFSIEGDANDLGCDLQPGGALLVTQPSATPVCSSTYSLAQSAPAGALCARL